MEIKDNKLVINTPKGMVIDVENSNLKEGIIKFRKKDIDYRDVCISLNTCDSPIVVSNTNWEKTKAISQLMDIADYYNKGWKPDWDNDSKPKYCISVEGNEVIIDIHYICQALLVFPTKEMAEEFLNCFRDLLEEAKGLY